MSTLVSRKMGSFNFTVIDRMVKNKGPVVQSIVSLMSFLMVKMLTVLVNTISNSRVFLLKKFEKLLTFF